MKRKQNFYGFYFKNLIKNFLLEFRLINSQCEKFCKIFIKKLLFKFWAFAFK